MSRLPFATIAITGKAGVGKTTVTDILAGGAAAIRTTSEDKETIYDWDKAAFATPIKELLSIKKDLSGGDNLDRRLYGIHEVVNETYNKSPLYGAPDYDDLIKLVKKIEALPLGKSSDKFRTFQQTTGDLIRSYNEDAFCLALYNRSLLKLHDIEKERVSFEENDDSPVRNYHRILVVSDLRFNNEAKLITKRMGGLIYELTASDNIRKARLLERDGGIMAKENQNHKSEKGIKDKYIALSIDTDELSPKEIADILREDIYKRIG